MDAEFANEIFQYARWDVCLVVGIIGFFSALWWLCANVNLARRRISALIDLAWTSLSVIGIVSALLVFGDMTWKAESERHTHKFHLAWDKLAALDSAKLIVLNCTNGQPIADALLGLTLGDKVVDSTCLRASQIRHWRDVEDLSIAKIMHSCPPRDLKFSTRDYEWTKDRFLGVSCLGTTDCQKARCEQEQAAFQILGAANTDTGKPLVADSTLSDYRSSLQDVLKTPMHEIYERTHPIKYTTAFYTLIPFWAFLLGARLARSAAELIDPTQQARICVFPKVLNSAVPVSSPKVITETEPEPELGPIANKLPAPTLDSSDAPTADKA